MVKPASPRTKYEPVFGWPALPHPMAFKEATSIGVDSEDDVYVFNRGKWPLIKFGRSGNFIETWGAGDFDRPHGIHVDHQDNLWLIDDLGHFIQKRDRKGKVLLQLGERGKPAPWQGGKPFNRPTHVVVHPNTGDVFISDGYGNSAVHRFDKKGKHIKSWGSPGSDPGQFSLPHNICLLGDDRLIVCDRENFRLQVFTLNGDFVAQWHMHRPIAIFAGRGDDTNIYVGEAGAPPVQAGVPDLGLRVVVLDRNGKKVTAFGAGTNGEKPDQFLAPHGIAVDSEGSVYIAEVSFTAFGSLQQPPREVVSLRKWRRASG
ncbi:MAG: peptidylglycine alpha-amidating monooxygenase [Dehalococcoidia bacterium]|nr:peptidylglycine alpha-amidating monooxygenase [Dehalococcoidia bacterium]